MKKPGCLVCHGPVNVTLRLRKKSGKQYLMLLRGNDPRHYRAFINDEAFVTSVVLARQDMKS